MDATKEAGIPRFVLVSILESDKAAKVPHFYNKYLTEKYLAEKTATIHSLKARSFLDWSGSYMLKK